MDDGSRSSNGSSIPMFKGASYEEWSEKMKQELISEGVWACVEEGTAKLVDDDAEANRALFLIRKSLSTDPATIFTKMVSNASTPKQAWETLRSLYAPSKLEMSVNEEALLKSCDDPTPTPLSGEKPLINEEALLKSCDDPTPTPLSGSGKPLVIIDVTLMKSAVKQPYQVKFPLDVSKWFPSTDLVADVMFNCRVFEVRFYGKKKQKLLGSGWKVLVDQYELKEGDSLRFEVLNSSDSKLKMNIDELKNPSSSNPPHQLQPRPKRACRERQSNPIIYLDDDDEDDDSD